MDYRKILQQAIDLHIHVGPEIIPRKFTLPELVDYEKGKLQGVGVKNHFWPTVAMAKPPIQTGKLLIIDSVVLNHYVGGFNPDIIGAAAELSAQPIIVWFPTLHTAEWLRSQPFEIPEEWIDPTRRGSLKLRRTDSIKALAIFASDKTISKEVVSVLSAIKECNAILATGHLAWPESYELVKFAVKNLGLEKIIVTHPIQQKIDMPINIQKELAELGAVLEHSYSMYSIDKVPMKKITRQIKEVGANNCILSSDVGQTFSKSPSESLADFMTLLQQEGVTEDEIRTMLIANPTRLVG